MAKLIYSVIMSLDGYVADEAGNFDWAAPDEEVHQYFNVTSPSAAPRSPARPSARGSRRVPSVHRARLGGRWHTCFAGPRPPGAPRRTPSRQWHGAPPLRRQSLIRCPCSSGSDAPGQIRRLTVGRYYHPVWSRRRSRLRWMLGTLPRCAPSSVRGVFPPPSTPRLPSALHGCAIWPRSTIGWPSSMRPMAQCPRRHSNGQRVWSTNGTPSLVADGPADASSRQ